MLSDGVVGRSLFHQLCILTSSFLLSSKYLILLTVFMLIPINGAIGAVIKVQFDPANPIAGEVTFMDIIADGVIEPSGTSLPTIVGLKWQQGFTRSIRKSTEGYLQQVIRYSFVVKKAGRIVIAPMMINVGKEQVSTKPHFLNTYQKSKQVDLSAYVFAKIRYPQNYLPVVGQQISLIVDVYYRDGLDVKSIENTDPVVTNCILIGHQQLGDVSLEVLNGVRYHVSSSELTFQALSASPASVRLLNTVSATVPVKKNGDTSTIDESIFSGYKNPFARYERVEYQLDPLDIIVEAKPLPKNLNPSFFTRLIGEWKFDLALDHVPLLNQPLTLALTAQGRGVVTDFRPPPIELPQFRVFPPEVHYSLTAEGEHLVTANYILIPLSAGEIRLKLDCHHYSLSEKAYKYFSVSQGISVSAPSVELVGRRYKKIGDIMPLQREMHTTVSLPLRRNIYSPAGVIFTVFTIIIFGLRYLKHRHILLGNQKKVTRKIVLKQRRLMLKDLRRVKDSDLGYLLNESIRENICIAHGLAVGSTATELRGYVDDELVEILLDAENNMYSPVESGFAGSIRRNTIVRLVKRGLCILCALFLTLSNTFATDRLHTGINAYAAGDFESALNVFYTSLDLTEPSPALLYNIGNCLFKMGDFAGAEAYYEHTLLVDPRNSDAKKNLRIVKKKILPRGRPSISNDMKKARDLLRPDEWVLVTILSLLVLIVSLYLKNGLSAYVSLIVSIISIALCASQLATNYDGRLYRVKGASAMYSLPSVSAAQLPFKLSQGENVTVQRNARGWCYVSGTSGRGWVRDNALSSLYLKL